MSKEQLNALYELAKEKPSVEAVREMAKLMSHGWEPEEAKEKASHIRSIFLMVPMDLSEISKVEREAGLKIKDTLYNFIAINFKTYIKKRRRGTKAIVRKRMENGTWAERRL